MNRQRLIRGTLLLKIPFKAVFILLIGLPLFAIGQKNPLAPGPANQISPVIYLGTEHGGAVVHDRSLPLLLRVRLGNPIAANIQMQNALAAGAGDADRANEDKKAEPTATANNSPSPVPKITVPSSGNSLPLYFDLRDSAGQTVNLPVRALRATDLPAMLVLDGTNNPQFYYGIDETGLAALALGKYSVRAVLSRKNAAIGEWSGEKQSAPLSFELRSGNLSPAERLVDVQQAGRFYLHDRNYPMVEKQAATLLELDKLSVIAWELRGDAFVEQGKLDDAEKAFNEALLNAQRHSDSVSPPLREPPEWLYQRLDKIRQLRRDNQR